MYKTIPARNEIPKEKQWNISDIFACKADWETARKELLSALEQTKAYQGKLHDPAILLDCLTLSDEIDIKLGKAFAYARLQQDTDTAHTEYQEMVSSLLPVLDDASAAAAFIEPELLSLPEKELQSMPDALPGLKKYAFTFEKLQHKRKHILSAEQEAFLASTGEIRQAAQNTYTTMTNADLKFPDTLSESGTLEPLSESRYPKFSRSRNRNVREDAFHKLFSSYLSFRNTFASLYSSSVKSSQFISKARNYASMQEAALDANNIPTSVYDITIETTHAHLDLLQRYMNLKKRLLELDELHMYDLYVSVVPKLQKTFPYEEGLQLIRAALAPLGENYLHDMFQGIGHGWIDPCENKGKRSGAYSWGVYGVHPFILTSYNEQYDAVSTVAHELGHSMHSFYSMQKQEFVNSDYTIFCAEVASITNENLLLEYMLKNASTKEERLYFINQYLEQIRTTVYRQVLFAEFEKATHQMVEEGSVLTADALEKLWLTLNRQYYGSDIVLDDELKAEWSRIPHFYRPFYVYQYATGYAAAMTLSQRLLTQGETARKAYLDYLASGGSDYSIRLLQKAGVDMTTNLPLTVTFQKFAACLDELEALTK